MNKPEKDIKETIDLYCHHEKEILRNKELRRHRAGTMKAGHEAYWYGACLAHAKPPEEKNLFSENHKTMPKEI